MSESRKLLVAFISAMVAISVVGGMQWYYVQTAQSAVTAETAKMFGSLLSIPNRLMSSPPESLSWTNLVDLGGLPTRQAELGMTRSTLGMLSTLAIFAGCLAVACFSRSPWPSVVVAAFGWGVNGVLNAVFTVNAMKLVADMPKMLPASPVTWSRPASGGPPFALYVLLGLFTTLLWQGLVPWVAGWFAGRGIRKWRTLAIDFDTRGDVPTQDEVPLGGRWRCVCGAVNLPAAESCYACGATLAAAELAAPDESPAPRSWIAKEWPR